MFLPRRLTPRLSLPAGLDTPTRVKTPLLEVHIDLRAGAVTATFPPPDDPFYDNRQVPVF